MTTKDLSILEDIVQNFDNNVSRLNNLISLYENTKKGAGRNSAHKSDLLRSVVIFNHASLEDFLRNIWVWKLPSMPGDKLSIIPLKGTPGKERRTKFDFSEIIRFRQQSLEDILTDSIKEYANTISFNRIEDIMNALREINISISAAEKQQFGVLSEMIKRRHHIVHQADRELTKGKGYHQVKSISLTEVQKWKKTVELFVALIYNKIISL
jgi:hypothetical protein